MGSVSVTWPGDAPSLPARAEFLAHLRQLAEANDQLLRERGNGPRNHFLEFMTARRSQGLKMRPNIELPERDIDRKILIIADLF